MGIGAVTGLTEQLTPPFPYIQRMRSPAVAPCGRPVLELLRADRKSRARHADGLAAHLGH